MADPYDIGFAGAGRMGVPMIRRLLEAGHRVRFFDPEPRAGAGLEELGALRVGRAGQLGRADLSISVVTDGDALLDVLAGADGIASTAAAGHPHISMGTVGPGALREAELGAPAIVLVDAPVSGSVAYAVSGELTAMVGAAPDDFERVLPVLGVLTRAQFRVGDLGAGSALKLAVNTVVAATNQAIGEALVMADAFAIARGTAYDVLLASVISSPYLHYKREAFLEQGAAVDGSIAMLGKDVELALTAAAGAGLDLPGVALSAAILRAAAGSGLADRDVAAVLEWLASRQPAAGKLA